MLLHRPKKIVKTTGKKIKTVYLVVQWLSRSLWRLLAVTIEKQIQTQDFNEKF